VVRKRKRKLYWGRNACEYIEFPSTVMSFMKYHGQLIIATMSSGLYLFDPEKKKATQLVVD